MSWLNVVVSTANGTVFLRTPDPVVEMTPGEALFVIRQMEACVRIALGAADGRGVLRMMGTD